MIGKAGLCFYGIGIAGIYGGIGKYGKKRRRIKGIQKRQRGMEDLLEMLSVRMQKGIGQNECALIVLGN